MMSMLLSITTTGLLESLAMYGRLFLNILLLYILMRVGSGLLVWLLRTLVIPLVEKRAYFYKYNREGAFYSERGIFGIFRLGRNRRGRINDTLVGYIATKRGQKNENPGANKIYLKQKGREFVGEAKCKYEKDGTWLYYTDKRGERVCNIYLTMPDEEGGYEINQNPVGYVDNTGRIYKYYANRDDWKNDKKLNEPAFVGQAETPSSKWGKRFKTGGERSDADVLKYIEWKANESNFFSSGGGEQSQNEIVVNERRTYLDKDQNPQMDDRWFFIRRNKPLCKRVVSKEMIKGGAVNDGARFPYAFPASLLWRFLHVYPDNWPCKAMAWGYGYCIENFRGLFKQNTEDIPMITRAAAALLLAHKEGFYIGADEVTSDGVPGAAATALLSLFVYILLFPVLSRLSSYTLFPFLGTEYSSVVTLVGLYFILWLCIINPIRCLIRNNHEWLEAFLELLNRNVGVLGWMATLVVSIAIGLFGSIFVYGMDYIFVPLFISALTAVLVNWAYYHQYPWGISGIHDDFQTDDSNYDGSEDADTDKTNIEEIHHNAKLALPTQTITFDEIVPFDQNKLKDLRMVNPFRMEMVQKYEAAVNDMIQKEFYGDVYSKILYLRARIGSYVNKYHLSNVEKVKLILRICQPNNIVYEYDANCEELYKGLDDNNPLLQKGKGFVEYCRFPTETIHDKRGDCDCHAAFAAALFAACGFRSCFAIGNVGEDNDSADHAMCGIECTPELNAFRRTDNSFKKDGMNFILLETVGMFDIEEVMEYQQKMSQKNTSVVIEPYREQ